MYRDTTPPVPGMATSPGYVASGPIEVDYTGAYDIGTGLAKVEMWYKEGEYGPWTNSGLTSPSLSGSFSFNVTGDGAYYFDLVAQDYSGNRSAPAAGDGDCQTIVEAALNASGRAFTHNEYLYPGRPPCA